MVTKKELIKAVHTQVQVSNNDRITILSKSDEDVALDVLTNGTLLVLIIVGAACNNYTHFV